MVDDTPAGLGPKVFFVWGTCCLGCVFFVYFCIFETKGLTLEQVDELYASVQHAWKSPGFSPKISFEEVEHRRRSSVAQIEIMDVRTEKEMKS